MAFYNKVSYHDAIKSGIKGNDLIVALPKNVNPGYLSFGIQKYHPCAVPLNIKGMNYADARSRLSAIKTYLLENFQGEPHVSRKCVSFWLVK